MAVRQDDLHKALMVGEPGQPEASYVAHDWTEEGVRAFVELHKMKDARTGQSLAEFILANYRGKPADDAPES